MKHSPEHIAATLNINAPTVSLAGSREQKLKQLQAMFVQAEEKVHGEDKGCDNREALHLKGRAKY